jgi:WD40 repeat protein
VCKNNHYVTALTIIKQSPKIFSYGTVAGTIHDFDLKSKKVVRSYTSKHQSAITSLSSIGKYLISCSSDDDLIIVYDYQK